MENRLLTQFNNVIRTQWAFTQTKIPYEPLNAKQLFELAYHTTNSVSMRNIFLKQSANETREGSQTIFYSNTKKFTYLEALDDGLRLTKYFPEGTTGDKLLNEVKPKLEKRKFSFSSQDNELKSQILKIILVERKLDECANYVMLNEINRKVYFTIGDARESAAVVPMFMEAEGSSLVQLALNKWMTNVQTLDQEKPFPDNLVPGLLKNLMQIKKWVLNLVDTVLDK
jgi:hypothetical protein